MNDAIWDDLAAFVAATRQMESAHARVDRELELMARGFACTALHTAQAGRAAAEAEREELAESLKSQGVPADLLNLL